MFYLSISYTFSFFDLITCVASVSIGVIARKFILLYCSRPRVPTFSTISRETLLRRLPIWKQEAWKAGDQVQRSFFPNPITWSVWNLKIGHSDHSGTAFGRSRRVKLQFTGLELSYKIMLNNAILWLLSRRSSGVLTFESNVSQGHPTRI